MNHVERNARIMSAMMEAGVVVDAAKDKGAEAVVDLARTAVQKTLIDIPMLQEEVKYLRAALEKITRREGPYALDPHVHAGNVITAMAEVAEGALAGTWQEDGDDD